MANHKGTYLAGQDMAKSTECVRQHRIVDGFIEILNKYISNYRLPLGRVTVRP